MARCAGMVLVLAAAAPALAQSIDDQERRDADCIDLFNDPRYADEDEASLSHNPATLRARMGAFVAAESNGPRTKPPSPAGSGTLDLDGMVSLVAGGGTRTGIWFGVAATAEGGRAGISVLGGELRMGAARRRYLPGWDWITGKCRVRRDDLILELLDWRFGSLNDATTVPHGTTFVSQLGVPRMYWRRSYSTWGFGVGAAVLEFTTAPAFRFGVLSVAGELSFRRFLAQAALVTHFVPRRDVTFTAGLGLIYEGL